MFYLESYLKNRLLDFKILDKSEYVIYVLMIKRI